MKVYLGRRKTFWLVLISFLLGVFVGQFIPGILYDLNPSGDRGALFVKRCTDLNGKTFSYENLSTLGGYIGLSEDIYNGNQFISGSYGYYSFEEKYFDQYLKGEYIQGNVKRNIKNKKVISVSEDNSFVISEDGGLEGNWKCRIKPDAIDSQMTTFPQFAPFYFFD